MKVLRNRKFAVCVMVILILGAALLGMRGSLARLSAEAQTVYQTGSDGLGSLPAYMADCRTCAEQLLKLGEQYLGGDAASVKAVVSCLSRAEAADQPADQYTANQKLVEAAETLYREVKAVSGIDSTDLEKTERLYAELTGNGDRVERLTASRRDAYNTAAEAFNNGPLRTFPASLLAGLLGIDELIPVY